MPAPDIAEIMTACIDSHSSDIHLSVGAKPILRQHTRFVPLPMEGVLSNEDIEGIVRGIASDHAQKEFDDKGSSDFALSANDGTRFRVSVFRQKHNATLVLRRIPSKILQLSEIGLPPVVTEICERARGLFLVTGPTGSGKTTTLASLINYINENFDRHIVTFEDPIEYYHEHKKSLVNQREIHVDVTDFPEALRRVLRQDPDVILVGEMRDLETIRAAVTAAETGHLVFATLHTQGAAQSVNRIIDVFPANEQEHVRVQLAGSLIAVLSQTLCPRLNADGVVDGVVAAFEFMQVTSGIRHMIRTNRPFQIDGTIKTGGQKFGMQLLDDHLLLLAENGTIRPETALEKARDPQAMQDDLFKRGLLQQSEH